MRMLTCVFGIGLLLAAGSALAADDDEKSDKEDKSGGAKAVDAAQDAADAVKTETKAAAEEAGMRSTKGKYGTAGCGLGSLIFSPDSGFTQVFAATTNGSSGNQTFGITSGTSNCDSGGGGAKEQNAKVFVQTNRAALAKDIARGRGETISSLSEIASCQNATLVGVRLRKNFRTIFPNAKVSDEQVSDSVVDLLRSDASLGCGNLG